MGLDENAPELWEVELVEAVTATARAHGCTCECQLAVVEEAPGVRQMLVVHHDICAMVIKDRRAQAAGSN